MSRIFDTPLTPDGPPDEPVVDQAALVSRRGILDLVVVGAGTAALASCAPGRGRPARRSLMSRSAAKRREATR